MTRCPGGTRVREAFEGATRRLALTGTPFRSDTAAIPFVRYDRDRDGIRRSVADYTYGYGDALRDHVVRPVIFLSYSGSMRWRTKAGDEISARLGEPLTKDITAQAWRTALDPNGEWIPSVLAAADRRLSEVRRAIPDAGAMVIATDQTDARAYAGHLARITGKSPTIVLSDDDGASDRIDEFSAGDSRWLVAVRMVSEGVDVPRLAVGVYATSTATPLFFAQAVGRFVRARRRGETASVFLPSVPQLLALANTLELERDHALDRPKTLEEQGVDVGLDDGLLDEANRERNGPDEIGAGRQAGRVRGAGGAGVVRPRPVRRRRVRHGRRDGVRRGARLPGPARAAGRRPGLRAAPAAAGGPDQRAQAVPRSTAEALAEMDHRKQAELRKELSQLVGAWARKSGQPHGSVHNELRRRCGGPEVALADPDQLTARVAMVRGWFVGKK